MEYVTLPKTFVHVATELDCWEKPLKKLFHQTDVSGYDLFCLYSSNDFKNVFTKTDENLYIDGDYKKGKRKKGSFVEIFHDGIMLRSPAKGEVSPMEGFVPVLYVAHVGLPNEFQYRGWLPRNGFIVPVKNEDGSWEFFEKETLIPKKTVSAYDEKEKAERIFSEARVKLLSHEMPQLTVLTQYMKKGVLEIVGREFDLGYYHESGSMGKFNVTTTGNLLVSSNNIQAASRPKFEVKEDEISWRKKLRKMNYNYHF